MKKVLVGGCFDLLHLGHISFLEKAKTYGDMLVVALESDENVRRKKGIHRPIHTQAQRKHMLESLRFVDLVIALPTMTTDQEYQKLVEDIHPAVIAITQGDPMEMKKTEHAKRVGANVIPIAKIATPSTSALTKLLDLE
jgi:FAD synthetase